MSNLFGGGRAQAQQRAQQQSLLMMAEANKGQVDTAADQARQLREAEQRRAEEERVRQLQEQLAFETQLRRRRLSGGTFSLLGSG